MKRVSYKTVTDSAMPMLMYSESEKPSDETASWREGFKGLQGVKVVKIDHSALDTLNEAEKEEFLGTVALTQALSSEDPIAIENALKRLRNLNDPQFAALVRTLANRDLKVAEAELSSIVSKNLAGVELKLWWNGERFLPALLCPSLKAALYVATLLRSVHGGALAVCPRCSTPFVQTRSNKHYCSVQCREAHRVARYRARLKPPLRTGKGKARARKASKSRSSSRRKKQ